MEKVLIIGTVWPEPKSSAAGSRLLQIIDLFQEEKWKVNFASTANKSDFSFPLESKNINTFEIELNNSSFDDFVKNLNPSIVVFDRFMIEEQFGWRVSESCPGALKIIDTEDLHCLRKSREVVLKKGVQFEKNILLESDIAKREIASIYRCDLSLIISKFEMDIMIELFGVKENLLFYLPFLVKNLDKINTKPFEEREHFITIGNFLHPPNWDSVQYLKKEIWPLIRKQLPDVEMHVYGSYSSEKVNQLHNKKEGFLIKGRAEEVSEVMSKAKVCLAPLRFGAGLKGKLLDAMKSCTPSVTTTIGSEGMSFEKKWGGFTKDDPLEFAKKSVELYKNKQLWVESSEIGSELLIQFSQEKYKQPLIDEIIELKCNLIQHRNTNFVGELLKHHTMQSTKYMSKWIEVKNAK